MTINLIDRVAIVTGAGGGLGRAHALALAARGARVVVNDLGSDGRPPDSARAVVAEIEAAGGDAMASGASVTDFEAVQAMVAEATARWGSVDILVNNAGVLRDRSFAKMEIEDFRFVVDVHLMGAVNCTKAVWDGMRARNYGRIVMTTSSSGLFGNFGQSNYGAAKMALVGLMQTLSIEGAKNDIRVNCLAPTASTAMTAGLMPEAVLEPMKPGTVSPAILHLVCENAPSRVILCAGAGSFERAYVTLTPGVFIGDGSDAAEDVSRRFGEISARSAEIVPESAAAQATFEINNFVAAQAQAPKSHA